MLNKILIVDDEPDIIEFLRYNLEKSNFIVDSVFNGKECIKRLNTFNPDLIILDVMMPKMNGVETCENIKSNPKFKDVIIVFLSARNENFSQIACYEAGGDDFISKPIQPKLLVKKIQAILKLKNAIITHKTINGITIDPDRYLVLCDDKEIKLPKKQFQLLSLLFSKPGSVFSRESIISKVWGRDYYISSRNIDVQVRKLREQIGSDKIQTIKGVGYKLLDQ
ncbi:MAG: DNA-binding response regulator [Flavobacteriales bacterium]|nr:DNA-binding response regulator [Flavobacteriales bacterium]|tara:strand:+ start:891 stop:1559 length:669 start_codon:yes stop_codon:yes gene_type:complete